MPAYTVATLIERARSAADMRDNFVTSTEWLRWLNVERYLLDVFLARNGVLTQQNTATVTANGAASYTITAPMAVLGVYEYKNSRYRRLKAADAIDGAHRQSDITGNTANFYSLLTTSGSEDLQLILYPNPSSGTYKVSTIAQPTALTLTTDTVTYPMGWEERLVLGLARRALAKEESPTDNVSRQINEIERHIEESAWDRVYASNQAVRNVDKVERGWSSHPTYPDPSLWYWI